MTTLKPIDVDMIVSSAKNNIDCIVTAEDHNIYGGLFGAVSETLARHYPCIVEPVALNDQFAESGDPEELAIKYKIDTNAIIQAAEKALKRKGEISVAKKEIRVNRAWTSRPTPELDKISEDLTELAKRKEIGFLVGHFEEYQALINILARVNRNNAILVGEEDVGKNTIVEHLALQILNDQVPEKLFDKRLVKIDLTQLFSNNKNSYDLQQNIKEIISEIELARNIIYIFQIFII